MLSLQTIKRYALAAGFDLCGVSACRTLPEHAPHLERWLARGMHGGMRYMERNPGVRLDPAAVLPGARSVISCAVSYNYGMHMRAGSDGVPRKASYAFAPDYHGIIKPMLDRLIGMLVADHPGLRTRRFTDAAPLLEKAWASESGLGWIGCNSLLVTPGYGSFVLLGEVIADMETDSYDKPMEALCGNCRRCVAACPTGAIIAPRVVDARRCIASITIERAQGRDDSTAPIDLHGWEYGCDACQTACPHNATAARANNPAFEPVF